MKDMQKRTGCKIFVAHQLSGRDDCTVVLTGTIYAVYRAFRLLSDEVPGARPQQRTSSSSRVLQAPPQKATPSLVQLALQTAAKHWRLFDEDEISFFTGLHLHLRLILIQQLDEQHQLYNGETNLATRRVLTSGAETISQFPGSTGNSTLAPLARAALISLRRSERWTRNHEDDDTDEDVSDDDSNPVPNRRKY